MNSPESLENFIPADISKKLNNTGVSFSELRQGCETTEKLYEVIYTHWRSGAIRVERNWNGMLDSPEIVLQQQFLFFA